MLNGPAKLWSILLEVSGNAVSGEPAEGKSIFAAAPLVAAPLSNAICSPPPDASAPLTFRVVPGAPRQAGRVPPETALITAVPLMGEPGAAGCVK